MRISDLSRRAGVPIATIKFYLRQGLLPRGRRTDVNQADYGDDHLRRLRLIRALTDVGRLDLSAVAEVLRAIEDPGVPLTGLYRIVDRAGPVTKPFGARPSERDTLARVDAFIDRAQWKVDGDAPGRHRFARALGALERLGCVSGTEYFLPHAEMARELAERELDLLATDGTDGPDRAAAAVRAVLLDVAFAGLRLMAREHLVAQRHPPPAGRRPAAEP